MCYPVVVATQQMDEQTYRAQMDTTLARIEKAFADVDPDLLECTVAHGAMTLELSGGARCILSGQPSVRQLWLAVAAKGVAYHFNWDTEKKAWLDDKTQKIELLSYLEKLMAELAKLSIRI